MNYMTTGILRDSKIQSSPHLRLEVGKVGGGVLMRREKVNLPGCYLPHTHVTFIAFLILSELSVFCAFQYQ